MREGCVFRKIIQNILNDNEFQYSATGDRKPMNGHNLGHCSKARREDFIVLNNLEWRRRTEFQ